MPRKLLVPCPVCSKERYYYPIQIKEGQGGRCHSCYLKERSDNSSLKTKEGKREYSKKWKQEDYKNDPQKYQEYGRNYRDKIRLETIEAYGGKCVHCEESDPIILVIDHIFDDRRDDKKKGIRGAGVTFYQWLRRHNYPKDSFQLLCHNCNYRKEYKRRKGIA